MDHITAFDWQRLLIGDQPPLFFAEIVFRTTVIYAYSLLLLRWLGSRTIGQLSTVEFLLVIALGSAIGDPMFYPDVPLLHALLVVTVVVLANKGLDLLIARFARAGELIDGVPQEVVANGVIGHQFLDNPALGSTELFQQLRLHGIDQLGQVGHAYVEADGKLTVFHAPQPRPGLPIVPPWEIVRPEVTSEGLRACMRCGTLSEHGGSCPYCGFDNWTAAVTKERFRRGDQ